MLPTRLRTVPLGLLLLALASCAGGTSGSGSASTPSGTASNPNSSASSTPTLGQTAPTGTAPVPASPAPGTTDARVVVVRSGGLAGIKDTITVEPGGQWTRVDSAGRQRSGRLTDDQRSKLRALTGAPGLRAEAGRNATTTRCRDAFMYALTVGSTQVSYADCPGDQNRPATAAAIVSLLMQATG